MVDSIDNSFSSLQRLQQQAVAKLNSSSTVGQVLAKKAQSASASPPIQLNAVKQGTKLAFSASQKTPPPRGSIVDRLV